MKTQEFLQEDIVTDAAEMHTDHEVQMARSQCYHAAEDAIALHKLLRHISEAQGIEGWVAAKITLASDYLNKVREYLEYDLMSAQEPSEEMPVAESRHSNSMKEQGDDAFGGTQGRQTYAQAKPAAPTATGGYKFTPDQEKWLGGANRQDPDILKRMPGPKPSVDYFKGADDQARAKTLNIGRSNLNTIKGAVGMQKDAPEVFPTKPPAAAPAPQAAAPKPQAAAPASAAPATSTRPTVVGGSTTVSTRPDSVKPVSTQTLTKPSTAPKLSVGDQLAQSSGGMFASRADRLNQDKVDAVLGKGKYKAGSAEANIALRNYYKNQQKPSNIKPSTTPTPKAPVDKQDNTNLGPNASDPYAQIFVKPFNQPKTGSLKKGILGRALDSAPGERERQQRVASAINSRTRQSSNSPRQSDDQRVSSEYRSSRGQFNKRI